MAIDHGFAASNHHFPHPITFKDSTTPQFRFIYYVLKHTKSPLLWCKKLDSSPFNLHSSSLVLQCCTHTNEMTGVAIVWVLGLHLVDMSAEQKFPQYLYLRVPWMSTWKAEFLCHMDILSLLPSLPLFFHLPLFIFIPFTFSCLLLAIVDM
ncbi:hypothetical protein BKA57DRAFT_218974 [Linnemannia elongata]|nr:hypothetical protein BKA57DRAFT_218974 [Linnemannia elongata]